MSNQHSEKSNRLPASFSDVGNLPAGGEPLLEALRAKILRLEEENAVLSARNFDTLECISEAFFTLDEGWRFSYANRATGILLNRPPNDLLGKSIWDEYPGLIGSDFEPVYRRAMHERIESWITEYYPDHHRWYEVNIFPASEGVTVYFKDVSERKNAEEEIERLNERNRDILESITDAFFALNADWRFTYVNPQAERLLDRPPGDLLGKTIWEEYPGVLGSEFEEAYAGRPMRRLFRRSQPIMPIISAGMK